MGEQDLFFLSAGVKKVTHLIDVLTCECELESKRSRNRGRQHLSRSEQNFPQTYVVVRYPWRCWQSSSNQGCLRTYTPHCHFQIRQRKNCYDSFHANEFNHCLLE